MKIIVPLLMLSSIIGPHAIAGDSKEALRNTLTICNQFVIQDPDPGPPLNDLRDCCIFSNHVGAVRGLVGIEGGVVSGVINLESPGVEAPGRRPRHDERYHEA